VERKAGSNADGRTAVEEKTMSRKAIVLHGTGGHRKYCWYPWLGARLEARGYAVELPHYPGLKVGPIRTFLN
jgi:hypothetical protein